MKKIWLLFDSSKRFELIYFSGLISFNTVLEAFSISLLVPIIVSLSDNNFFELYPKFATVIVFFQEKFSLNLINTTLLLFITTIVFKNIFQIYINYKDAFLNTKISEETSQKMLNKILNRNYSYHLKNKSSDLVTKIRIENKNFAVAVFSLINILSDLILVTGLGILLLILTLKITISIILLTILLSYIFLKFFQKFITKSSIERQELEFKRSFLIQENIQGVREIIISNIFEQIQDSYKKISNAYGKCTAKFDLLQKIPKIYFELIALIALVTVLYSVVNFEILIKIDTVLPTLALYAACTFKILPAANRIVSFIQRYKFVYPAVVQVYDQLNSKEEKKLENKKIIIKKIDIKNLTFSYDKNSKKIFEDTNFTINSGDKILIRGQSGKGKSTLLDLIVGLQKPVSGNIVINENKEFQNNISIFNSLGYVSQKIFIFNESLEFNITLKDNEKEIDNEKLQNVIKLSCIDFHSKIKNKKQSLGEFGSSLSGGQKQRLMIARALYKSDEFLIMDEPTSSLDYKTGNSIIEKLTSKKNLTVIMVTHDNKFNEYFNKIYEINNRKIMEVKNVK